MSSQPILLLSVDFLAATGLIYGVLHQPHKLWHHLMELLADLWSTASTSQAVASSVWNCSADLWSVASTSQAVAASIWNYWAALWSIACSQAVASSVWNC